MRRFDVQSCRGIELAPDLRKIRNAPPSSLPASSQMCGFSRIYVGDICILCLRGPVCINVGERRPALNICAEVFLVAKMNLALRGPKGRLCFVLRVRETTSVKAQLQV